MSNKAISVFISQIEISLYEDRVFLILQSPQYSARQIFKGGLILGAFIILYNCIFDGVGRKFILLAFVIFSQSPIQLSTQLKIYSISIQGYPQQRRLQWNLRDFYQVQFIIKYNWEISFIYQISYLVLLDQVQKLLMRNNQIYQLITNLQQLLMSNWQTSNSIYGSSYNTLMGMQKRTYTMSPSSYGSSPPKGLQNLTNTCYISAVLQVLFQIIKQSDFPIKQKSQQQITYLFFHLKQTKDRDEYKQFKLALQDRVQIVRGWDQQDAHQLLIQLIDQFRKENSEKITGGKPDLSFKENKDFSTNWKAFIKQMQKIEKGKIISLFYGEILKQYKCPSGHQKHNFERYSNLSLPFSPKNQTSKYYYSEGALQLKDMIQQFLGEQTIQDLICQQCQKKRTFKKLSVLYTVPKYLILHLSRFTKGYYDSQKNGRQVSFDEVLNIEEQSTRKSVRCQLRGVIHHIGSLNRGHYYADVKIDGEWYEFDDEKVTKSSIYSSRNKSKSVYLLVYQRT